MLWFWKSGYVHTMLYIFQWDLLNDWQSLIVLCEFINGDSSTVIHQLIHGLLIVFNFCMKLEIIFCALERHVRRTYPIKLILYPFSYLKYTNFLSKHAEFIDWLLTFWITLVSCSWNTTLYFLKHFLKTFNRSFSQFFPLSISFDHLLALHNRDTISVTCFTISVSCVLDIFLTFSLICIWLSTF